MRKTQKQKKLDKLGKICAECRQEFGISQKEVAERLGTRQTYISRFELGQADSEYIFSYYIANLVPAMKLNDIRRIVNDCETSFSDDA